MNRNEQEMYSNISSIAKSLEKIANALDNNATQTTKDIPGFEGTLDALDNLCNVRKDDFDVQNDYLNDLVQGMNQIEFLQFHSSMNFSFASNDSTAMSDAIYELEYEECLGAIETALFITGDRDYVSAIASTGGIAPHVAGRKYVVEQLVEKENTTQPENDPYTYEHDLQGIRVDSDHDIRSTAAHYEIEYIEKHGATKKECILDYVTNEFGLHGARYTDIIKFAYYLGEHNAPKYTNANRGYYACAFNTNGFGGHLVQGGKNQLVKGINKEGKERYFALSSVEQFTDYFKRLD